MSESTLVCPKCSQKIKLTESLAAPLLAATKAGFEQQLAQKDADIIAREAAIKERAATLLKAEAALGDEVAAQVASEKEKIRANVVKREAALAEQLRGIDEARAAIGDEVDARVKVERERITAEEGKKAKALASSELERRTKELSDLQEVLTDRTAKLAEAQQTQADLLKKQRELDDAKRELDVTVEKKVQESLGAVRDKAKAELEDGFKLRLGEKDETISSMQRKIEELAKKAEQGSQQMQGEVLELELEKTLRARFPRDIIEPVPKGEHGGDILHRVVGASSEVCGTILWESKRAKNWSDNWLTKLRDDQRTAKAEIALIVTTTLPKGVKTFDQVDGVWITEAHCLAPVALALRQTLIELAASRLSQEGQQTKKELVYQYLTGPRFKHRIEAIVERFGDMQADLERERKAMTKLWAKREEQIRGVIESTVGMYGDLQGIAGRALQEIESFDILAIANASDHFEGVGEKA